MMSVVLILRKNKVNSKNLAPISIRIIHNRITRYIPVNISVAPHHWDARRSLIKQNHTHAGQLNAILNQRLNDVQGLAYHEMRTNPNLSADDIKNAYLGRGRQDFFAIAQQLLSRSEAAGSIGTHDKNLSVVKKLRKYIKEELLPFDHISTPFIRKYEQYLREELQNSTNTISSNLKFMRRVFNEAYQQGIIPYETNPFLKLKVPTEPTTRAYLNEEELLRIERLQYPAQSIIESSRSMFLWACYSAGVRISDILLLTWDNFDGTHIAFTARKTKQQHRIKLPAKSLEILQTLKRNSTGQFIFPFIPESLDISTPRAVDLAISRGTARYNKQLKIIAEDASINKKISSHTARHTFATQALAKGMSLHMVQRHLQHKNPAVTQIYAKISHLDLDRSMEVFDR